MEQFDTDENLVSEKKKEKSSTARYLLIGIVALIVIVAAVFLFKYITNSSSADKGK
jgi:flagellar basal body-associated protein FliL